MFHNSVWMMEAGTQCQGFFNHTWSVENFWALLFGRWFSNRAGCCYIQSFSSSVPSLHVSSDKTKSAVSSVPCSFHFADLPEVCCTETSKYQEDRSCSSFQGAAGSLHFACSVLCEMLCIAMHHQERKDGFALRFATSSMKALFEVLHQEMVWIWYESSDLCISLQRAEQTSKVAISWKGWPWSGSSSLVAKDFRWRDAETPTLTRSCRINVACDIMWLSWLGCSKAGWRVTWLCWGHPFYIEVLWCCAKLSV